MRYILKKLTALTLDRFLIMNLSEDELARAIARERLMARADGIRPTVSEYHPRGRGLSVIGLWAVLFPVVLALAPLVLNIPLLEVGLFWFGVLLFVILVG